MGAHNQINILMHVLIWEIYAKFQREKKIMHARESSTMGWDQNALK